MIVAANRLPISISLQKGAIQSSVSPGGLAASLNSLLDESSVSVGWPGKYFNKNSETRIEKHLGNEHAGIPVFLTQEQIQRYYLGFSNKTLWPLLHDLPEKAELRKDFFASYKEVNKLFAQKIASIIKPGEAVFIQDFHLFLLPKMIREILPGTKIGFFLHTPFPTYTTLLHLPIPILKELLRGVLGADIIGFHTTEFGGNFIEAVEKVLHLQSHDATIMTDNRDITIETVPLGIDYPKYLNLRLATKPSRLPKLKRKSLIGRKVLFSVDRLDYTKGILERLQGYELFLQQNPDYHHKIVFIVSVQPSRTELRQYQLLKTDIETTVKRINASYGDRDWKPITYQYVSLDCKQIFAHFSRADIALVTPLRDGMNLVAKEYIASKENDGVLILSQTAGAAKELTEALLVDPSNISEIAMAIKKALEMSKSEQKRRLQRMQLYLEVFTSGWWSVYWKTLLNETQLPGYKFPSLPAGRFEIASNVSHGKFNAHVTP